MIKRPNYNPWAEGAEIQTNSRDDLLNKITADVQVQEAFSIPSRQDWRRTFPHHITVKGYWKRKEKSVKLSTKSSSSDFYQMSQQKL
jgi:hypothetical protein